LTLVPFLSTSAEDFTTHHSESPALAFHPHAPHLSEVKVVRNCCFRLDPLHVNGGIPINFGQVSPIRDLFDPQQEACSMEVMRTGFSEIERSVSLASRRVSNVESSGILEPPCFLLFAFHRWIASDTAWEGGEKRVMGWSDQVILILAITFNPCFT
jgi:hypothetical protein